ncbi:MAG: hypothetical protein QFC55_03555 [Chloroflexota bacterium]|nr:hypothetical protein [Chloroflexota bacterium]
MVRERIASALPSSGDLGLDQRLARAIDLYRSPDLTERTDALEKLWDGWAELKTLRGPLPKGIERLIAEVAHDARYADELGSDAQALNKIGNDFHIRHFEKGKIPIQDSEQVDYFFGRLFNLIWLFLRSMSSVT